MAITADSVIVELEARIEKYKRDMRAAGAETDKFSKTGSRNIKRMEDDIRKSSNAASSTLKRLAGTFAAAFSVQQISQITDSYTRFQNQLKVAGLEGQVFADVQEKLRQTSVQYGVELESLGSLYSRLAQVQNELGASQSEIIQLNNVVAASLKVAGTDAQQASGALLQLSQALGSGTVRAEEFNSILEGALPLAQAAARGMEGLGGSVAKLRAEVVAGNVSSQEFFQAVLKGGVDTIKQAENATLTLSGAMEALRTEFTLYIGEANKVNGATQAVAAAIKALADNLDVIIPAIAIVGTALGVGYVANLAKARIATLSLTAASQGMLAVLGGPVGLAITAVTVGLGYLAAESAKAEAETQRLRAAADANAIAMGTMGDAANSASGELGDLDASQVAADASAAGLKVSIDRLADSHYAAAVAARTQRIEEQKLALAMSAKAAADKAGELKAQRRYSAVDFQAERGLVANRDIGGFTAKTGKEYLNSQEYKTFQRDKATLDRLLKEPITPENIAKPPSGTTSGGAGRKRVGAKSSGGGGSSGPTPEQLEAQLIRLQQSSLRDLERLAEEELQAKARLATSAEERAEFEQQILDNERESRLREIDQNTNNAISDIKSDQELSKKERDQRIEFLEESRAAQIAYIERLYGKGAQFDAQDGFSIGGNGGLYGEQLSRDIAERELQQANEMLAMRANVLDAMADVAVSTDERNRLEQSALEIQQQIEQNLLEQAIATGEIVDAQQARLLLEERQGADRQRLDNSQRSPIARYIADIESDAVNFRERTEELVVQELDYVRDGISDAITKQLGVKDPLIAGLLDMFIEQVIMRPIAEALANAGSSGGGGLFSLVGGLFGLPGRASGGHVQGGGAYVVGERGPELFAPSGSGKIYPTGSLQMANGGQRGNGGGQTIIVDAKGAVMNDEFARMILSRAKQMDIETGAATYKKAIADAPGAISQRNRYG